MKKAIVVLGLLIAVLSFVAAAVGAFWQGTGDPFAFTTLFGETATINGSGLYRLDSVSGAAQEIAQDYVTLFLGIPLLLISLFLSRKGSLRGRLLLTGTLGYFLYTYASMAFLTAYNQFFLIYTALFSLSLFGFILSFSSISPSEVHDALSANFPRRSIAVFCFSLGSILALLWLGRIAPSFQPGVAPVGLDAYTTLVIQALDLGLIVPLAFLTGVFLLRKRPMGYLLASVFLVKGTTLGAALVAMIINMRAAGVPVSVPEMVAMPAIAAIAFFFTVWFLLGIKQSAA